MAELEELEQEQIDEQMLNIQSSDLELPEVPEAAPAAAAVARRKIPPYKYIDLYHMCVFIF